ncbi:MAG: hypothetical protein ABI205_10375 [Gemmatimonadaceae bacterium]
MPTLRARRGFTIAEMILSMTLMLTLIGLSTQLFRRQSNMVATQTGRLDAQSNSRYALSMLDRELRMAGAGVVDAQPLLVQAGALAITFNADLVALDTGDLTAVYINPDADSAGVNVMRTSAKIALPGTSTMYPDSTYMQGVGVPSNAETISYWLSHDSTTSNATSYILFRRVNARPVKVVARGVVYKGTGDTIFQYFKGDTLGNLTPISPAALPLVHTAAVHGSQADIGNSALTDSIRQVRVQFTSLYHDPRTNIDTPRRQQLTIHLMNAGLIHHTTCGNAPLDVSPTAVVTPANGTTVLQPFVTISWAKSVDDGAGEKDVERYALYRRLSSVTTFDMPFASIPSGSSSYSFVDSDVLSGQTWIYGVTAQDCTPSSSIMGSSLPVVIP